MIMELRITGISTIFLERKDVLDPHKWLSEHAPNIKTFFWLGKYKYEKQ